MTVKISVSAEAASVQETRVELEQALRALTHAWASEPAATSHDPAFERWGPNHLQRLARNPATAGLLADFERFLRLRVPELRVEQRRSRRVLFVGAVQAALRIRAHRIELIARRGGELLRRPVANRDDYEAAYSWLVSLAPKGAAGAVARPLPPSGTLLSAEYEGEHYMATIVEEKGERRVKMGDETFGSLSAAARAITGYATNGWRFWSLP